jgi:hypothetical protein
MENGQQRPPDPWGRQDHRHPLPGSNAIWMPAESDTEDRPTLPHRGVPLLAPRPIRQSGGTADNAGVKGRTVNEASSRS